MLSISVVALELRLLCFRAPEERMHAFLFLESWVPDSFPWILGSRFFSLDLGLQSMSSVIRSAWIFFFLLMLSSFSSSHMRMDGYKLFKTRDAFYDSSEIDTLMPGTYVYSHSSEGAHLLLV